MSSTPPFVPPRRCYIVDMFSHEAAYYLFTNPLNFDPTTFRYSFWPDDRPDANLICLAGMPADAQDQPNSRLCVLDFSLSPGLGPVIPQRLWTPTGRVSNRQLQLPIWFFNISGGLGLPLVSAAAGHVEMLACAQERMEFGGAHSTHIRINWPGYDEWHRQVRTRDETAEQRPITRDRWARHVGRSVELFLQQCGTPTGYADPRWQVGPNGNIVRENIVVIGAVHVHAGSWQPILQLMYNNVYVH
ncbi:hypothetical protein FA95DRAFT_1608289 [Auriscalpium vulgare]|uniref:Uncharacterized protein n=1 Tax=Auriscalpium vulgare TaxID=40419 RepID=A0ACB8RL40_9AGAM|nr:hypothetical protein FA95DRAFT_1608289 [Auriscalpium vulgare]